MTKIAPLVLVCFHVLIFASAVFGQEPCKAPNIVFNRGALNIFTEEQDVYLGDALAETIDKELSVIADGTAAAYLNTVGERVARHLPPTTIKFRFFIVDAPELNAFSVAGGRIYVTRKLVSFVKSEDELAGILGHEMGHAVVRHTSIDFSTAFKEILGVEKLGDRDDVYRKVHELLDRSRTKRLKIGRGHEDNQQLEADQIGVYAMTAAGYDPNANITAWERLTETDRNANRRGWFGGSRPDQKRLREMLRAISALPSSCRDGRSVSANEDFKRWQSYVVSIAKIRHAEKLSGLISKGRLQPYLRGGVKHFKFSPDGKYVIAQDESGINILSREPLAFLFRINIDDAKFAKFSPDSKSIIIQTYGLRVEAWDVEMRRPMMTKEVYVREACTETSLSPDGKTLICYSVKGDLHFIDVETSEKVYSKTDFYPPGVIPESVWTSMKASGVKERDVLEMEFSPDGRYLVAGAEFRPIIIGGFSNLPLMVRSEFGEGQRAFIAFDLTERKELKVSNGLKEIASMPFTFTGSDKIVGQYRSDEAKAGVFNFPSGERADKFSLRGRSFEKTTSGDYVIVRPMNENPAAIYSISQKKFVFAVKNRAVDGFGDTFVTEGLNGSIDLTRVKSGDEMEKVASAILPRNELANIKTVEVSDNLDRIALSVGVRGGVWNLKNGARKIYIRGFNGAFADSQGAIYADFPAFEGEERSVVKMDPEAGQAKAVRTVPKNAGVQIGRYYVRYVRKDFDDKEDDKKNADSVFEAGTFFRGPIFFPGSMVDMKLEVSDAATGKALWSRVFDDEPPDYSLAPDGDTVSLSWPVKTAAAANIIRKSPGLSERARSLGQKDGDYLVQILDAATGVPKGHVLIETGEGSFSVRRTFATDDWLTVIDSENRVLFYSIRSGELKARTFGEFARVNPASSIAVVENLPGILSVENLMTGRKIGELKFPSSIVFVKFTTDGSKLFVLTAAQEFYIFDSTRLGEGQ